MKRDTDHEGRAESAGLLLGDCREVMATLQAESVDAIVTDPPYGLSFMGKGWDHAVPGVEFWTAALRVAKPGAHLVAFGGTRTFHRLACAIEDAGWELRDTLAWVYGSGFPKSLDVSKAIDKASGAEREVLGANPNARPNQDGKRVWVGDRKGKEQSHPPLTAPATAAAREWQGWGTALKPAFEPIVLARKPLVGTVAENVLAHGTGALNIDGCRITATPEDVAVQRARTGGVMGVDDGRTIYGAGARLPGGNDLGRWPANLAHDGSEEVLAVFPETASGQQAAGGHVRNSDKHRGTYAAFAGERCEGAVLYGDSGSAARFFYCAKASGDDRGHEEHDELPLFGEPAQSIRNPHPTVKPTALMRWLVRLVTPPNGLVLDPFMGSGSTGVAALQEGFRFTGIELDSEHLATAERRIRRVRSGAA